MSISLIRDCDNYVVIEPGKEEIILSEEATLSWLESWLCSLDKLPKDLSDQPSIEAASRRLLDTACDLEIEPGFTLQWFAVRLSPSNL